MNAIETPAQTPVGKADRPVSLNERIEPEKYDKHAHARVLEQLSADTGWRVEEIDALYKRVMLELAGTARVHHYLFVLVPKRIRRMVGNRRRR